MKNISSRAESREAKGFNNSNAGRFIVWSLGVLCLLYFSCNLPRTNTTTGDMKMLSDNEKQLVVDAYQNLFFCKKISEEGFTRSTTLQTNELASSILINISNKLNELERLATEKNVKLLPGITELQLSIWKQLIREKGRDFDKAYLVLIARELEKSNSLFTILAQVSDPDLMHFCNTLLSESLSHIADADQANISIQDYSPRDIASFTSAD